MVAETRCRGTAHFIAADATFEALFANNVRAPFMLVAAFAPKMAANGTGNIVNIGSMSAHSFEQQPRRSHRSGYRLNFGHG